MSERSVTSGSRSEPYSPEASLRRGGRRCIYTTVDARKQRNRDAQAAFRGRRAEYIKQLEGTVEDLQEELRDLKASRTESADADLMLRYKNSLLERILVTHGIDVQAELNAEVWNSPKRHNTQRAAVVTPGRKRRRIALPSPDSHRSSPSSVSQSSSPSEDLPAVVTRPVASGVLPSPAGGWHVAASLHLQDCQKGPECFASTRTPQDSLHPPSRQLKRAAEVSSGSGDEGNRPAVSHRLGAAISYQQSNEDDAIQELTISDDLTDMGFLDVDSYMINLGGFDFTDNT